ncbi:hypothetical protein MNBD_ALPHA01-796 [hydrothermal vent metagenome]|uniref:Uncharacterized protein n=1 Tax=hydrothermal vent metagenome TaxID=652676 RepID=A0A3B0RTS5_9ZZZZ
MNKQQAIDATKLGSIAAYVSGAMTLVITLIARISDATGSFALWNDPWIIIDVVIIFTCAYGMYKQSRSAALVMLIYFIFAKIFITIETGNFSGLIVGLLFSYFFARATYGAFIFHKIEKSDNPDYRPVRKWTYFVGIPTGLIILLLTILGLMSMTEIIPSNNVLNGIEMSQDNRDTLISNDIINSDDHIEYYYFDGLVSILDGGVLLTDDRIILFMPDENQEILVYQLYFYEIASIDLLEEGGDFSDSIYKVTGKAPDSWIQFGLSLEKNGHEKFIEALRSKITRTTANE